MIKELTNAEIEKINEVLTSKDSFRHNMQIKLPGSLDWSLRINFKKLQDIYIIYKQACQDIGKKFIAEDKVDKDGQVKEIYALEYKKAIYEIMMQKNEIDFRPLKVDDIINLNLSSVEKDVLYFMCETDDIDEHQKIDFNNNHEV